MTPLPAVVDASVVISWLWPDEGFTRYDHVYTKLFHYKLCAPHIIEYEMLNFIVVSMKKRKFTALQLEVFKLSEQFDLTAYDAAYLELARRLRLPLLTYDDALLRAAKAMGIKTNI